MSLSLSLSAITERPVVQMLSIYHCSKLAAVCVYNKSQKIIKLLTVTMEKWIFLTY